MRISEYEAKQRQEAEKRRREREAEEEYYRMEGLGILPESVPIKWLRGDYG